MTKVFVYWNLHRNVWSVKNLKTDRIMMRTPTLTLKDAVFKVSEAGRQRVLREKRKNVHAGVVGYVIAGGIQVGKDESGLPVVTHEAVSYNPYNGPDFINKRTGQVVTSAKYVQFSFNRLVTI